MALPRRTAIPSNACMLAGTENRRHRRTREPVMELYLWQREDETYLVEWQYVEPQGATDMMTRQEVAECDTVLLILKRLADFAFQNWDTHPDAVERYETSVITLLEQFFSNTC